MASRKSTRHGASASTRRTGAAARSARGSSSRTRSSGKSTKPRASSKTAPKKTASRRAPARSTPARKAATRSTPARSPRRAWAIPLFAVVAVVLLGWTFYTPLKIQYQESREQARLEAELESLRQRNDSLSAQVERLRTPEGVEEVARETLGMVKEGEHAYVVLDSAAETTASTLAQQTEDDGSHDTVWDDLLDLVFGAR